MNQVDKRGHVWCALTSEVIAEYLLPLLDVAQGVIAHARYLTHVTFKHRTVHEVSHVSHQPGWSVVQGNIELRVSDFAVAVRRGAIAAVVAEAQDSRIDCDVSHALQKTRARVE